MIVPSIIAYTPGRELPLWGAILMSIILLVMLFVVIFQKK